MMASLSKNMRTRDFGLADWLNLLAGTWLILSPFVLGYNNIQAALAAELTLGVILVSLSAFVAIRHAIGAALPEYLSGSGDLPMSFVQVPIGTIIILAPFIFGYSALIGLLIINEIIIGSLVVLVSLIVSVNHALIESERARETAETQEMRKVA